MAAIELIDTGYTIDFMGVRDDIWTVIRELVQNAIDGETEFGAKMSVGWAPQQGGIVVITNSGVQMPRKALATGWSSKRGRDDLRGKKGFGLKQAAISAQRLGIDLEIQNGNETWKFIRQHSKQYDTETIHCRITTKSTSSNSVRVQVPCGAESWQLFRSRLLFLDPPKQDEIVKTKSGSLLLSPRHRGEIYVQGIWVEHQGGFGYDFSSADILDVERRMVSSFEADRAKRRIWDEAIAQRPDLFQQFLAILEDPNATDLEDMKYRNNSMTTERLVEDFKKKHGPSAIPVRSTEAAAQAAHLGLKGVLIVGPHVSLLEEKIGSLAKKQEELKTQVTKVWGGVELEKIECQNFMAARNLSLIAFPSTTDLKVDVVDFRRPDLMGLHQQGRVMVARKRLASTSDCLATLVHELAHEEGGDGEKSHVAAIERAWTRIVHHLLSK